MQARPETLHSELILRGSEAHPQIAKFKIELLTEQKQHQAVSDPGVRL
jgi:hypothetical protein